MYYLVLFASTKRRSNSWNETQLIFTTKQIKPSPSKFSKIRGTLKGQLNTFLTFFIRKTRSKHTKSNPLNQRITLWQQAAVTIVVLTTNHQVRCIFWKQMTIFNKGIGLYCGFKYMRWIYFVKKTFNHVYVWCYKYALKLLSKMCKWIIMSFETYRSVHLEFGCTPLCSQTLLVSRYLLSSSFNIHYNLRDLSGNPIVGNLNKLCQKYILMGDI